MKSKPTSKSTKTTPHRPAFAQSDSKSVADGSTANLTLAGVAFVALLALLVTAQGGYYPNTACAAGLTAVALVVIIHLRRRRAHLIQKLPWAAYLFTAMGVAALIGSALNDLNTMFVLGSAPWFFAAAIAMVCAFIQPAERQSLFDLLGWVGVISGALGILMFAGILPIEGTMNAGRLQFTFQYANAAGIWFAVMTLLAATSKNKLLQELSFFPLTALILTQSVGASLVFALAVIVVLFFWARRREAQPMETLLAVLICGCLAGGTQIAFAPENSFILATALAGFGVLFLLTKFVIPKLRSCISSRKALSLIALLACVAGAALCLGALAVTGRLPQAQQTFIERILQTQDAFTLLLSSPLFGIGPDAWAYSYQNVQTIQYLAFVVHNSYAQVALNCGLVGLALFAIILIIGFAKLAKSHEYRSLLLAVMMALHFLMDFDLRFASLLALFIFFMVPPSPLESATSAPRKAVIISRISLVVTSVLCATGCLLGLVCDIQRSTVNNYAEQEQWEQLVQTVDSNALLAQDPDVREVYLEGLVHLQEYERAAKIYESWDNASANEAIMAAYALYALDRPQAAETVLLDKLFQQPKNVDYFNIVASIFETRDASEEAASQYAEAAALANQPAEGLGALMTNQQPVPKSL